KTHGLEARLLVHGLSRVTRPEETPGRATYLQLVVRVLRLASINCSSHAQACLAQRQTGPESWLPRNPRIENRSTSSRGPRSESHSTTLATSSMARMTA